MQPLRISEASPLRARLREELRHSEHARYLNRLHFLLLVAQKGTCYEVARCFGESARLVERWVHWYEERGIEGLRELPRGAPGARKLTGPQLQGVKVDLQHAPRELGYEQDRWSGSLCARHLERKYGVTLSPRHCQRLFRRAMR